MSKLIELVNDIWTFGCKGDVIRVADEDLDRLDAAVEKLGVKGYKEFKVVLTAAENAAKRAEKAVEADVTGVEDAAKADAGAATAAAEAEKKAAAEAKATEDAAKAGKK